MGLLSTERLSGIFFSCGNLIVILKININYSVTIRTVICAFKLLMS